MDTPGLRAYIIRRDLGPDPRHELSQRDMAERMAEAAKALGLDGVRYDSSVVARIESGARRLTLDDVAVIAAVDPKRRGRAWLAWGEGAVIASDPYEGPEEDVTPSTTAPPKRTSKPVRRVAEQD